MTHVGRQNDWQQLQDGQGFSYRRCPMTPIPAQEGTGAWSFLPSWEGRGGGGHSTQHSPGVPNTHGCNRQPHHRNMPFRKHKALLQGTAEPPESPFGPHMPSQGAELGQNLTFPRNIHEPVGGGKESPARTQPLVPTAMWSWLLLPSKQVPVPQAQPEAAHPTIPLCYRENPKCWLGCWKRAPPPIPTPTPRGPQHSLMTQAQPGPWHPEPLANLPLTPNLVLILSAR